MATYRPKPEPLPGTRPGRAYAQIRKYAQKPATTHIQPIPALPAMTHIQPAPPVVATALSRFRPLP